MNKDSLSHTSWNCKYHIVFAPKFRRAEIYGKLKADIGKILRDLCERKGIEIIEAECCKHILLFICIDYMECFNNLLKGKYTCKIKNLQIN